MDIYKFFKIHVIFYFTHTFVNYPRFIAAKRNRADRRATMKILNTNFEDFNLDFERED